MNGMDAGRMLSNTNVIIYMRTFSNIATEGGVDDASFNYSISRWTPALNIAVISGTADAAAG